MRRGARSAAAGLLLGGLLAAGCGVPGADGPTADGSGSLGSPPTATAVTASPSPAVGPSGPPASSVPGSTGPTPGVPASSTPTPSRPSATGTPTPGTCALPSGLLGTDFTRILGTRKVVALTFDAGGDTGGVAAILDTLAARDAPATFFLTGRFAAAQPTVAARIAGRHAVGNHTQDHLDLTRVPAAKARAQIRTGAATILRVTGHDPRPYFRFPMGAVTPALVRLVNSECYLPVRWTVDTLGWQGTDPDSSSGGMSATKVVDRVLAGLTPGAIILMHVGANPDDHTTFDADALPRVIDGIRARGYTLVDLTALVADRP